MSFDLLIDGGPVLWLILACGLLAGVVFIERALHLHRARIKADDFLRGILNILNRGNVSEALAVCGETPGPTARLVRTGILYWGESREVIRAALDEVSRAEFSRMERRLVIVATVAQITPLLGLLGTVLGMVESLFLMRYQSPLIQFPHVSDGLLRALVTTGAGLMVAIPCYAAFNLLVIKIDRIVLDMDRVTGELLAFLWRNKPPAKGIPENGK